MSPDQVYDMMPLSITGCLLSSWIGASDRRPPTHRRPLNITWLSLQIGLDFFTTPVFIRSATGGLHLSFFSFHASFNSSTNLCFCTCLNIYLYFCGLYLFHRYGFWFPFNKLLNNTFFRSATWLQELQAVTQDPCDKLLQTKPRRKVTDNSP